MSTLQKQEPVGIGLRRLACEQVELAIRCLTRQAGQGLLAAEGIEQARAILSLIELDLPATTVRRERAILDRLSQRLAELNEPTHLANQLALRFKKTPADKDLASAVKTLTKRYAANDPARAALSTRAGSFNPIIYRLVADMAELRGHIGNWPTQAANPDTLPRGLRRAYARLRRFTQEPTSGDHDLHLARLARELAHQLSALNKCCPAMLKAHRKLLTRAAEALSQQHFEALLDQALRSESSACAKALEQGKASGDLYDKALRDLHAALAETPSAFINRMSKYWSRWRSKAD